MVKSQESLRDISFSSVPEWLRTLPDYQPWENGKKEVWNQIEKLFVNAAPQVYDSLRNDFSEEDSLAVRLLVCWLYHWESAGIGKKGTDVLASVAGGRGFVGNGLLGGNPFFDLVHAQALCDLQEKAVILFQKDHLPYLRQIAKQVEGCTRFDDDIPCWWGPFYMALTGTASEKTNPSILRYKGFSGLRLWLRMALNLFLRRFVQQEAGWETDESELQMGSEEDREGVFDRIAVSNSNEGVTESEWSHIRSRFLPALKQARALLTEDEWIRLYYHFGAKLQNQQVARLYHESESKASRHRDAALLKFRGGLVAAMAADPVLRDLNDSIFSTWGNEIGSLMQVFFENKGEGQS